MLLANGCQFVWFFAGKDDKIISNDLVNMKNFLRSCQNEDCGV